MTRARCSRRLAGALAAAVAVALGPAAASAAAHAVLERAVPAGGAAVAVAPREVRLRFSEPIVEVPDSIRVLGQDRRPVDAGDGGRDPRDVRVLRVRLPRGLDDGVYIVRWKAVSADTHPIEGLVPFAVGDATAAPVALPPWAGELGSAETPAGVAGGRALAYAGSLLLAGVAAFWVLVARPAAATAGLPGIGVPGAVHALVLLATLVFGLGAAWSLAGQAEAAGSVSLALDSTFGTWWVWRLVLVLVAAVLVLATPSQARWPLPAAAAVAVAALAGWPPAGHVLTSEGLGPRWVLGLTDFAHLVCGALWVGILAGLAVVVSSVARARREHAGALWRAVAPRASVIAMWSFLVLAATGTWAALAYLDSPLALLDTEYGNLLAIKLGAVTAALVVAAWQRFVALYELRRLGPGAGWMSRFAGVSRLEAGVVAGVAIVTGLLATSTPP